MNVKADRRSATEEVSGFASSVINNATQLMVLHGLRLIETRESSAGLARRRINNAIPFDECPEELVQAAMVVKDHIAEIFASVGVTGLEVVLSPEERRACLSTWKEAARDLSVGQDSGMADAGSPEAAG